MKKLNTFIKCMTIVMAWKNFAHLVVGIRDSNEGMIVSGFSMLIMWTVFFFYIVRKDKQRATTKNDEQ